MKRKRARRRRIKLKLKRQAKHERAQARRVIRALTRDPAPGPYFDDLGCDLGLEQWQLVECLEAARLLFDDPTPKR